MSTNIKTWQERKELDSGLHDSTHMEDEIAELRAALALAQAPSAPVAPDERAAFCTWYNAIPGHELTAAILKGYSDVAWLGWQARAALSVKAELPRVEVASTGQRADNVQGQLVVGKFYWVWIALDPDAEHEWDNDFMPARFAGYDEQGGETWNFLDSEAIQWATRSIDHIAAAPTPPTTGEA